MESGEHCVCLAGNRDTILFLFIYTTVYRFYKCRIAFGCNIFVPDFISYGRFGKSRPAD